MKFPPSALLFIAAVFTLTDAGSDVPTRIASARSSAAPPPIIVVTPAAEAPEPELITIRRNVHEVRVLFTVSDGKNQPVRDLTRQQVMVLDSAQPVEVTAFERESGLPLRLGVLIDTSVSMAKQFGLERRSAEQLLQHVLRADRDRAFIVSFNTHAHLRQAETSDAERLTAAIQSIVPEAGLTALYDAVFDACDMLRLDGEPVLRRAIVLLSDGEDNFSLHALVDAVEAAQRAEVTVYTISVHGGSPTAGDLVMKQLAAATGGVAVVVSKLRQFDVAFTAIENELHSQYSIAYKTADVRPDGKFHRIGVRITAPGKFKVHARAGYWAPRQ